MNRIFKTTLGLVLLTISGYIGAIFVVQGVITAYRMIMNGSPSIRTYTIFPQRAIENASSVSILKTENSLTLPETLTFPVNNKEYTFRLSELFAQTDTKAFIIIRNDTVIYEKYLNGASRDSINPSFSIAKSFTSTLIGIAIDEGKIRSVDDPVIQYLPELKGRGLDALTIRDMLIMSSGIPFQADDGTLFPLATPFTDDARQYYTPNLRSLALGLRGGDEPVGSYFRYNDYYLLLEGIILERVTGRSVTEYFQEKIWKPMGMEYPASWSLDSESGGFEKVNVGLNARAIDFARFGQLFLHKGQWQGRQIISEKWVTEATIPDPGDRRPWKVAPMWPQLGGYYKFHWWGFNNPDGTYDYMARGWLGQIIYVSPSTNTVVVRLGGGPQPDTLWPFVIRALIRSL